ncbi:MAG: hypothetical protein PHN39_02525 [Candidatus Pacebacteria bacterium]|nr:hypothetical protein [Candidatus Paceibacterota bacterium]
MANRKGRSLFLNGCSANLRRLKAQALPLRQILEEMGGDFDFYSSNGSLQKLLDFRETLLEMKNIRRSITMFLGCSDEAKMLVEYGIIISKPPAYWLRGEKGMRDM